MSRRHSGGAMKTNGLPLPGPRKRLGQNFLHDPAVIEQIIDLFGPKRGDRVVEIGPGRGALTGRLLDRLGSLDVIELDRDLVPHLKEVFTDRGQLTVHEADVLSFNISKLATNKPLRVIGNLPYNISTPLLFHLFASAGTISDMCLMLQKEVVDRMVAEPGSKSYGRLSVMVGWYCKASRGFNVRPGAFSPPPKVDSSIVLLQPHSKPPAAVEDLSFFTEVVRSAFSQRRKTLRNALKQLVSESAFEEASVDPGLRAEAISINEFARLSNAAWKARE